MFQQLFRKLSGSSLGLGSSYGLRDTVLASRPSDGYRSSLSSLFPNLLTQQLCPVV